MHLYEDFKIWQIHYQVYLKKSRSRSRREVKVKVKSAHIAIAYVCQSIKLINVVPGYHGYKLYSLVIGKETHIIKFNLI